MSLLSQNLQAFMAVKAHRTVASAADSLRLTQSAVTLRIQSLERDVGTDLFIRSRRGMSLTAAGESLARYCQRALELEAETFPSLNLSDGLEPKMKLIIQGPSSPMKQRVLSQAARYLQQYKNILIEYRITDLESGIDRLKEGSTNLLITERSKIGKEFDSKLLKPERYILVGPYSWKNRKVDDIIANERIIDFDPSDTMTYCFLEKYDLLETSNRERYFVNITEYISDFVISGVGFSVLSKEMAAPLIADKKLIDLCPGKFFDYEVALAWYPRKHMSRSFKDLIAGIK